jgi:hypothetical protein
MNDATRAPFLAALDAALLPLGFKRPKSKYEWRKRLDAANTAWIHLNFGLDIINPSFGVHFTDLLKKLPEEAGAITGVCELLQSMTKTMYSTETVPELLAKQVVDIALPKISDLTNRPYLIQRLKGTQANEWPVWGSAFRIRLLPLLLADNDQLAEAHTWLDQFERDAATLDQLLPKYEVFASCFRQAHAG